MTEREADRTAGISGGAGALGLYRAGLALAAPFLWRGRAERLAGPRRPVADSEAVFWIHGASNGELTSARPVAEAMLARDRGLGLVITANTGTAAGMVAGWGLPRTSHGLAPIDRGRCLARFGARHRPAALILVESELWPNRLLAMRGRPVAILGARLSARSAARWARVPGLAARLMGCLDWLSPQDAASAARFRGLGLPDDRIGPVTDLKRLAEAPPLAAGHPWAELDRAATVLAASTHPGEEEIVLDAFARARAARPGLRLILAPRHPRRAAAVARLAAARSLACTRRSSAAPPGDAAVLLVDTMGELAALYTRASAAFLGGSLVQKGGHTPYEPAAAGTAILHGPHLANFAGIYGELMAAGASLRVGDAEALAAAFLAHDAHAAMARRAAAITAAAGTGLDPLLGELARITDRPALARPHQEG